MQSQSVTPQPDSTGTQVPMSNPLMEPLSVGTFMLYIFLFAIPLIGFIIMLIFAFSDGNINRKNFARATLMWIVIGIALFLLLTVTQLLL